MAFAYMLRCRDGSYYVGSTSTELERRIAEHDSGKFKGYTSSRLPVSLVWSQEFQRITDAITAERQIKGWGRAKKEALIRGDFDRIAFLAERRSSSFETRPSAAPQDDAVRGRANVPRHPEERAQRASRRMKDVMGPTG
ncbi:MAG: GIY-YIG nuclease family protein [Alphaproteobacteria bacterium]|nr:GIY-YIG nuclease family protein [Alphaproteobacteria bacterium]